MRPGDDERCAVCIETMQPECRAGDINERDPGDTRTHLQFMYDRRVLTHCQDLDEEGIARHFRDYALNRMLAPFRDNLNKKRGKSADRTYESRNLKGSRALANICGYQKPGSKLVCIRTAGHQPADAHKF